MKPTPTRQLGPATTRRTRTDRDRRRPTRPVRASSGPRRLAQPSPERCSEPPACSKRTGRACRRCKGRPSARHRDRRRTRSGRRRASEPSARRDPLEVSLPSLIMSGSVTTFSGNSSPRGILIPKFRSRRKTMSRKSIDSAPRSPCRVASRVTSSSSTPSASTRVAWTFSIDFVVRRHIILGYSGNTDPDPRTGMHLRAGCRFHPPLHRHRAESNLNQAGRRHGCASSGGDSRSQPVIPQLAPILMYFAEPCNLIKPSRPARLDKELIRRSHLIERGFAGARAIPP